MTMEKAYNFMASNTYVMQDRFGVCVICKKDCVLERWLTCSDACHDELVRRLVDQFGEFKKIVRASTGVAYKVPTMDIIERGIREQDLDRYPRWEEDDNHHQAE